jgi:hypothetical protein
MNTTPTQIEELLERRLQEAGLAKFVNKDRSQFLDLSDELFVELVLNDGGALDDVEKIVRRTAEELKTQGIRLDTIVRALWEVVQVDYVGPSRARDGGLRAASEFHAKLKSGSRECYVRVDVSMSAADFLQRKLGAKREPGVLMSDMIAPVVKEFLQKQLRSGGTSYWSPLLYPQLDLNEAAMSFLLGQSTAFEELRQAVSDAFDPNVIESFLRSLAVSRVKMDDFTRVLPDLSNMLGGAYRRGDTFSTSASALFEKLVRTEQELLKAYFQAKVEWLKMQPEFQGLISRFPQVFA